MSFLRDWLRGWHREWVCLCEFWRLLRRSYRYSVLVYPMYFRAVWAPRSARLLRAAYCLARHLDDVLDGDHTLDEDPERYTCAFLAEARERRFSGRTVPSVLGAFVFAELDRLRRPEEAPCDEFVALVECMLTDLRRGRAATLWSSAEIEQHMDATFRHSLNITLLIAASGNRAGQLQPLIRAQGILYSLRDLAIDLARGIVNIPAAVYRACVPEGATARQRHATLLRHEAGLAWARQELDRAEEALTDLQEVYQNTLDTRGRWVVGPLQADLGRIARRLAATLGEVSRLATDPA